MGVHWASHTAYHLVFYGGLRNDLIIYSSAGQIDVLQLFFTSLFFLSIPSSLRYGGLQERRRPFVESLRSYGDSLMLLPAFSYGHNTPVSLRALYTIQDFDSPLRPVFLNPEYLQSLAHFWQGQGLRTVRLSTGLIVASLALELCANVHLYGFWPFNKHPHRHQNLTNHYYDDRQSKKTVHAMPAEFDHLLRLHTQGVLRIHLGECTPTAR